MRITYIHQYFALPSGGGGTRSYEFAKRLVAAGHQVRMVTSTSALPLEFRSDAQRVFEIDGIQVVVLPVDYANNMDDRQRLRSFLKFTQRAIVESLQTNVDIIYATSTPLSVALPALARKHLRRTPYVFEVRDLWPEVPFAMGRLQTPGSAFAARTLEKMAYRGARHVVALSPGMAEGVIRTGVDPARVTVIPNSADIDRFSLPAGAGDETRKRLGLSSADKLVLYAGAFGEVNNPLFFVQLADATRSRPDIRYLLVGAGALRNQLVNRAREFGVLNTNLAVWDPLAKDEIARVHAAADICTSTVAPIPELENNSANKVFDAFAAGKPVAINHGGWLSDLLRDSGAGITLPSAGDEAARQLVTFLDDTEATRRASVASARLGCERFSRDHHASELERILIASAATRDRS